MIGTLAPREEPRTWLKRYKYTLGLGRHRTAAAAHFHRHGSLRPPSSGSRSVPSPSSPVSSPRSPSCSSSQATSRRTASCSPSPTTTSWVSRCRVCACSRRFSRCGACAWPWLAFERDLGSALLFYTLFLIMLYVATGRISYVVIGIVLLFVGGFWHVPAHGARAHAFRQFGSTPSPTPRAAATSSCSRSTRSPTAASWGTGNRPRHARLHPRRSLGLHLLGHRRGNGTSRCHGRDLALHALRSTRTHHRGARQERPCGVLGHRPHCRHSHSRHSLSSAV